MGPKRKKGFTLIELLVVIAIIALLLSIVMPALNRAKVYAQRVLCGNNLRQQTLGIMLYADQTIRRLLPPD
jgi:prepilin-type N-terminal cleavage/methylation domain-containing protein